MEFRPLEINVISAKDLKDVNLFTKMDVYVVVSINGDYRSAQRTPADKGSGSNPEWNCTMKFTVDEAAVRQNGLSLVFHLKSERQLGDRDIGTVQFPVKELLDDINGKVSCPVRLPNGKAKGVLNFGYKFGEKFDGQPSVTVAGATNVEKPAMAYPPPATGYSGLSSGPTEKPAMAYPPPATSYPPPPGAYPPPQTAGYPYPQPGGGYPPYGYHQAPAQGYGYPGHGGYYGYPPVQKPQKPKKNGGMGAGLGLGLAGGLLGGMLVGDMVGDAYEDGVENGLDFDF
ncbi:P-loop containing nucleoside triphosphate hydrolases superfamily protein [Hibiscus syriacus]|uniref:P-loop containing nucleoside triphosphate hydrolases superfamily protein n=1 Tax=Hibiscus syriacus TaxID=106335 RepID=A0A6A2X212_HIBSY|nr:protein SRC2-like [Hibiscus syriacus]KAE8668863.1 P-loop containing nucleoside triphosphate hydrolases superfamily protein [Hibiscus syriacus]